MADTMNYMEGSAAVLGEFMLPLLCPENETSASQRELARPYARDLGLAFQLTNMIRDIGEDIELGRQYIPVETCNKFGVHLSAKDHASPQFHALMEHMLSCTDKFYRSADIGIAMLPIRVRHSIQAARAMYSHIHDSIRTEKYNVFSRRAR